jgi:hypothetical protein
MIMIFEVDQSGDLCISEEDCCCCLTIEEVEDYLEEMREARKAKEGDDYE